VGSSLEAEHLSEQTLAGVAGLAGIAQARGQTLAALALNWALRDQRITSLLLGVSSVAQLEENVAAIGGPALTGAELAEIDKYAVDCGINLWAASSAS